MIAPSTVVDDLGGGDGADLCESDRDSYVVSASHVQGCPSGFSDRRSALYG